MVPAIAPAIVLATVVAVTIVAIAVATVVVVARTSTTIAHVRRRNDAQAADIATGYTPAPIIVVGALALAGYKSLAGRTNRSPILEDVARLWAERPHEHDPGAAIVAVRIVPRVVIDEHAEPHARIGVGVPVRVTDEGVAVVAEEARIVVLALDVVRHNVVVPVGITFRNDALRQIGERDVWITAHAAIRDHAVIPMIATFDAIVGERIGGRDGE